LYSHKHVDLIHSLFYAGNKPIAYTFFYKTWRLISWTLLLASHIADRVSLPLPTKVTKVSQKLLYLPYSGGSAGVQPSGFNRVL
jgi:hypothetical protein